MPVSASSHPSTLLLRQPLRCFSISVIRLLTSAATFVPNFLAFAGSGVYRLKMDVMFCCSSIDTAGLYSEGRPYPEAQQLRPSPSRESRHTTNASPPC